MTGVLALCGLALLVLVFNIAQYIAMHRLEAAPLPRLAVDVPRHPRWPEHPGGGRHRRPTGDPDAWLPCHTLVCAHLTRPHTRTPAGLVCDECGTTTREDPCT